MKKSFNDEYNKIHGYLESWWILTSKFLSSLRPFVPKSFDTLRYNTYTVVSEMYQTKHSENVKARKFITCEVTNKETTARVVFDDKNCLKLGIATVRKGFF